LGVQVDEVKQRMLRRAAVALHGARCGLAALLLLTMVGSSTCWAWPAAGSQRVLLHASDGSRVQVGTVEFRSVADARWAFTLKMDPAVFTDHFLSMREFKCLIGGTEILCHVPYPYAQPATVSETDFAWLEHALLFMFKRPGEFGAKLWNGICFKLIRTEQGLVGKPQAVDLNQIGAPPARLDVPPFKTSMRHDLPEGARWFNRLSIEP
jgi:hypothetical protein